MTSRDGYSNDGIRDLTNSAYQIFQSFVSTNRFKGSYDRLAMNRLMYAGINHGQWKPEAVDKMTEAGYPVHTINFVQGIIDTTQGHVSQSPIDTVIRNVRPDDRSNTNTMQSLYDIDQSNGEWDKKFNQFILDGLIHSGWMQMLPSTDSDVRGNVGMDVVDPAHIFPDPYWITEDIKDCRRLFKAGWMTPKQIKVHYNTKNEAVDNAIQSYKHYSQENPTAISQLFDRSIEYYDQEGDRYKVIEYHYLEDEHEAVIIDTYTGEEVSRSTLPEEVQEMKPQPLKAWMKINGGDRFSIYDKKVQVSKFITFCPALGLDFTLEHGDYPYQVGHLPFFRWSYHNMYGEPLGLMDLLVDVQQILNKRESQITKILNMKTAANWAVESDAFGGDTERIKDFNARVNRTGQSFTVEPGTNANGKIKPLFDNSPINDLRQQTQSLMDYFGRVSNVTAASQGSAQPKQDGNLAFDQAQAQSLTVMEMLVTSVKDMKRAFAKAYVKCAVEQYGNDPRVLYDAYSEKMVALNVIEFDALNNEITTSNTLQDAKWYQTSIEMKRMGEGLKKQRLNQYGLMLNSVSSPAVRTVIEFESAKLMNFSDEANTMLDAAFKSQFESSMLQTVSAGKQAEASAVQSDMMIEQAQNPQPQPPQGGGQEGMNGQGGLNPASLQQKAPQM